MSQPTRPEASAARAAPGGATAVSSPPDVPPVPRPLTPRARRRSWAELPVRVWLILSAVILIVTVVFTITRVSEAMNDRRLIEHGQDVVAKFTSVNGDPFPKRRPRNEPMPAAAVFDWQGKPFKLDIPRLEAKPGAFAMVGEEFRIKVDPDDPSKWTEETIPRPWWQELTVIALLVPMLLALLIVAGIKRQGVLRVWRDGVLAEAAVVETHQSAAAPMSRVVRFTLVDQPDRRIFSTLTPAAAGIPGRGEKIWIVHPSNRPTRAVIAALYV
jgi:hypothetical protein